MSQRSIVLTALLLFTPFQVLAWDTGDSPSVAAKSSADLEDAFFFLDPNDNTFVIMAVTLRGYLVPSQNGNLGFFDPGVKLRFDIDNTNDARSDLHFDVKFGDRIAQNATQVVFIKLPKGKFEASTSIAGSAFGPVGPPTFGDGTSAQQTSTVITDPESNISFYAGLIDDPFFADAAAFESYRRSRFANQTNPAIMTRGRDGFAGYNTLAAVLRVPVATLLGESGTTLGLTVSAKGSGGAKDRVAHPFVNALLIDYPARDAYNAAKTTADAAGKFAEQIAFNLQALQTSAPFVTILMGMAVDNGDMLRLNTSIANTGTEGGKNAEAAYPNGRRPNDDVVDTVVTLVNNGVFQGDAVNDNELPMRDSFPFFARPHMPFPPGAGSEDLTRN